MDHQSVAYVGFDTSKTKQAVAVAESGREGEGRYLGEIETTPAAVERLLRKLACKYKTLHVSYEAGPTGYGLYRHIRALGHVCDVIAPSLVPRRPGDRVTRRGHVRREPARAGAWTTACGRTWFVVRHRSDNPASHRI